jgi:hypothetical protein
MARREYIATPAIMAKIKGRCRKEGDCLIWEGPRQPGGPMISLYGTTWQVRRFMKADELAGNPFSLFVVNTCGNPLCIFHLEVVSQREMQVDDSATCAKGHAMKESNIRWRIKSNGKPMRQCKQCRREIKNRWYQRKSVIEFGVSVSATRSESGMQA